MSTMSIIINTFMKKKFNISSKLTHRNKILCSLLDQVNTDELTEIILNSDKNMLVIINKFYHILKSKYNITKIINSSECIDDDCLSLISDSDEGELDEEELEEEELDEEELDEEELEDVELDEEELVLLFTMFTKLDSKSVSDFKSLFASSINDLKSEIECHKIDDTKLNISMADFIEVLLTITKEHPNLSKIISRTDAASLLIMLDDPVIINSLLSTCTYPLFLKIFANDVNKIKYMISLTTNRSALVYQCIKYLAVNKLTNHIPDLLTHLTKTYTKATEISMYKMTGIQTYNIIMMLVEYNKVELVRFVIDSKLSTKLTDNQLSDLLLYTYKANLSDLFKYFTENGAKLYRENYDDLYKKSSDITKLIISDKSNTFTDHHTILFNSVKNNNITLARHILDNYDNDPNKILNYIRSVMKHSNVIHADTDTYIYLMDSLVSKGETIDYTNLLYICIDYHYFNEKIIKYLIDNGVDIFTKSDVFSRAVQCNNLSTESKSLINYLLKCQANTKLNDDILDHLTRDNLKYVLAQMSCYCTENKYKNGQKSTKSANSAKTK